MSLIDADTIVIAGRVIEKNGEMYISANDVVRCINKAPTAYDLDAVVRELEAKSTLVAQKCFEAAEMGFERASIHYQGIQDGLDSAIEVVMRGGRNE